MPDDRKHLPRLNRAAYQGHAFVHWVLSIQGRRKGWLDTEFFL